MVRRGLNWILCLTSANFWDMVGVFAGMRWDSLVLLSFGLSPFSGFDWDLVRVVWGLVRVLVGWCGKSSGP